MVRYVLAVIALLIGLMYSFAFLLWNSAEKVNVITWHLMLPNPVWVESVPIGMLPLLGAFVGAVVALALVWSPWTRQRAVTKAAEAKLQKAVKKFNEQKARLTAQNEEIAALEDQVAALQAQIIDTPAATAPHEEPQVVVVDDSSTPADEPVEETETSDDMEE